MTFKRNRCVFIGGAPRTGTSLMVRMLDWHPDVLMFPVEPKGLANFFFGDRIDRSGKEYDFTDRARLEDLSKAFVDLGEPYNAEIIDQFDTNSFAEAADEARDYIEGLRLALITGLVPVRQRYGDRRQYFGLKNPFYVEASIAKLSAYSEAKFVICDRDAVARYASSKARTLKI